MIETSIERIVKATGGELLTGSGNDTVTSVRHDSRECGPGSLFVAIKGERNDGHDYIGKVLDAGCRAVLVSHEGPWMDDARKAGAAIVKAEDTVYAMGEMARDYLRDLDIRIVAVTGSVGKTSVRDMIYYVLKEKFSCGRNLRNFNSDVGLPLSIFEFDHDTEVAVLEMGMDSAGQIKRLAEIADPDVGVITNIGISHLENLGSREGIFRAKMEVADHLAAHKDGKGVLVYAGDDEFLTKERTAGNYGRVSIGMNGKSDYIISSVDDFGLDGIQFTLEHKEQSLRVDVPVPGQHSAVNASLAIAVGMIMGMTGEEAAAGIKKVSLTGSRLRTVRTDSVCVIDDTYNASPASMKSALKVLESSRNQGRKTAVLGDMYELGADSDRHHFGIGVFARGLDIDRVIAVGENARRIYEGALGGKVEAFWYETKEDLFRELPGHIGDGDVILVKASRGMKMEEVVDRILEH